MRNAFINTILDACVERENIFIISGDAGLGVFDTFKEKHPERFINLGAAEQNMISFAAGMAMTGFKVVIYNIIPFVLYRCYEQVRNDICYQELPVILAGIGSGLTYAPQGMTHYSVEDIALAGTMPNLEIFSPIDPVEARLAAKYSLNADAPVYVRLAKRGEPELHCDDGFDITQPQVLRDGAAATIACHGSIAEEALKAADELAVLGITVRVISVPCLQPLPGEALAGLLCDTRLLLSVEEHYSSCGLGGLLTGLVTAYGLSCRLVQCGVPHRFIHEIHNNAGMRRKFGISAESLATTIMRELEK